MMRKFILLVLLAATTATGYFHVTAGPSRLDRLMRTSDSFPAMSEAGMAEITPGPAPERSCEPGRITVFVYYSGDCPESRKLMRRLRSFLKLRPDVAVRLIGLPIRRGRVDYREEYGIDLRSVPHVIIYDVDGELLAADDGADKPGLDLLYDWMNAELSQDWREKQTDVQ